MGAWAYDRATHLRRLRARRAMWNAFGPGAQRRPPVGRPIGRTLRAHQHLHQRADFRQACENRSTAKIATSCNRHALGHQCKRMRILTTQDDCKTRRTPRRCCRLAGATRSPPMRPSRLSRAGQGALNKLRAWMIRED